MQEVVLFYNGLDVPTRQILNSRGAIPSKTAVDAKLHDLIQDVLTERFSTARKDFTCAALRDVYEKILLDAWINKGKKQYVAKVLEMLGRQIVYSGDLASRTPQLAAIQAQLNNLGREIKKVNEKVYAAQVGCEQCKGPYYTKDCPLNEEGKTLKEAYYTQFGAPFQGGGYKATAPGFYQRNNANPSYQERRQSMEDTLSKFMSESAKRHEENSNLIKEIRASTDAAIRNQGASIKTLEIQIDFAVLEDMDAYRDEGMGDVIFGEPFLREVRINAKRFEGMITIHNGNEEDIAEEKKSTYVVEISIWKFLKGESLETSKTVVQQFLPPYTQLGEPTSKISGEFSF
ncbi:hypothetical protein Tco_0126582 [Tanacetum coccineum]